MCLEDRNSSSSIYKHMANHKKERTKEELKVNKERGNHIKEIWWKNTKVQAIVNKKKTCFNKCQRERGGGDQLRKQVKNIVPRQQERQKEQQLKTYMTGLEQKGNEIHTHNSDLSQKKKKVKT